MSHRCPKGLKRAFSHVGIYVGDGKFIHSPKPGAEVRVESMRVAYWNRRFDGARRVSTGGESSRQQPVALQPAALAVAREVQVPKAAVSTILQNLESHH